MHLREEDSKKEVVSLQARKTLVGLHFALDLLASLLAIKINSISKLVENEIKTKTVFTN